MTLFWTMMLAVVTGTVATFGVLMVCNWNGVSPNVKVWLCRLALLKWPFGLLGLAGLQVTASAGVSNMPSWHVYVLTGIGVVYVVGFLSCLCETLVSWYRARRAMGFIPDANPLIVERVHTLGRRLRVRHVQVKSSKNAPAVVMFAPKLLLSVADSASDFAVAHELSHVLNRDLWWTGLASLINVLFWFVPWIEALHREMRLWQDVLADESALRITGTQAKTAVDEILAATSTPLEAPALSLGADAACFAKRFRQIYGQRRAPWLSVVAVVFAVVLSTPIRLNAHGPTTVVSGPREMVPIATIAE